MKTIASWQEKLSKLFCTVSCTTVVYSDNIHIPVFGVLVHLDLM